MALRTLAIGLSSALGYVDMNDDEFYYDTRGIRPIDPTPSIVYFQPLPDVVSNNFRPNPIFQDTDTPVPDNPTTDNNTVSKIVSKLSSCFSRRRKRSQGQEDDTRSCSSPSGSENQSSTESELTGQHQQESDALRIAQPSSCYRDWCEEDPRPEVDQSENRNIGVQLRMISDRFLLSPQNNISASNSNIHEIAVCLVVTLFISAITYRYYNR